MSTTRAPSPHAPFDASDRERNHSYRENDAEQLRRLANVVIDSNDAITVQGLDGHFEAWNHGAERMYGYTEAEALMMNISQLVPEDERAQALDLMRQIQTGEPVEPIELHRVTKDGRILDVWLTATKVFDVEKNIVGVATTERDITKRKEEEKQLRRLANVVIDSNDAITVQGLDGHFEAWNHGAERMYGYTEAEALMMNISQLVPEDERAQALDLRRQIRTGEPVEPIELHRVTKDGRILDVWLTVTKVLDDEKNIVGVATTERDMTQRNKAEVELRVGLADERQRIQEIEFLNNIDNFRRQVINGIAHELNTPLTPMKIQLHILKDYFGDVIAPKQKPAIDILNRNIERLERMIQDLLNAARAEGGKLVFKMQPINLGTVVEDAVEAFTPSAAEAGIAVEAKVDSGITVTADANRITEVLANLFCNALKFTSKGGPITVVVRETVDGALVRVGNTGIGITAEDIDSLFKPFTQLPAGREQGGAGLGLYLARKIVEEHGGRLWCESPGPGGGTTFLFELPT
jgi:two-component system CheB/CheR fusion protein